MRSYRYFHYDVFTDRVFGGNQLALVLDARGLAHDDMQAIAKEMNFAETAFLLPAEAAGTDARVRIFTPARELAFAGHPVIGTTFGLARAGAISPGATGVVLGCGIGPVPVSLTWRDSDLAFAWMAPPLPVFGEPVAHADRIADVLGLPPTAVGGTGLPVQVVSSGTPYLFVPLATRRAVDSVTGVGAADLAALFKEAAVDAIGLYAFSVERAADKAAAYARMFAPGAGVPEDAATGSAAAPLGAYLVRHKVVPLERAASMVCVQGAKMGRTSHLHIAVATENGMTTGVRVGGEAVLAGEGTLYL